MAGFVHAYYWHEDSDLYEYCHVGLSVANLTVWDHTLLTSTCDWQQLHCQPFSQTVVNVLIGSIIMVTLLMLRSHWGTRCGIICPNCHINCHESWSRLQTQEVLIGLVRQRLGADCSALQFKYKKCIRILSEKYSKFPCTCPLDSRVKPALNLSRRNVYWWII